MSRALDLLGVVSPSSSMVARAGLGDVPVAYVVAPAMATGLAGYALCKSHPVLGFFAGEAVGANAYRLYRRQGNDVRIAGCGLATQAVAVTGSLLWKKHSFYGYLLGFAVGSAASALVPGSNANKLFRGK